MKAGLKRLSEEDTMKRGFLLLAVCIAALFAGCNNYHLAKGDENYQKLQYDAAIDNYRKFLRSQDDPGVRLKLAESCMKLNRFHEAFEELSKVRQQNDPQNYWLFKGRKYMEEHRYDSAEVAFKKYLENNPRDPLADELCRSCSWIYSKMQDTGYYEVKPVVLTGFKNYFSPTLYKNGIIFTASKEDNTLGDKKSENKDFNLYYLEKDSTGEYKTPVLLDGEVNGAYNETCPCVNPDDGQLIFSRSQHNKKVIRTGTLQSNLKILFADYKNNSWSDIREFPYNDQRYSVGQPSVSGKSQLFFFVSDKPGGNGGSDLYYSIMTAGGFSQPVNLGGTVNTAGNEMFPWYNEKDSCLYFSSEGHNNFGGLDIFKVKFVDGKAGVVQNLGFPVNSSKDDFSYLLNPDGKSGYFSSNRSGNDRLYEVKVLPARVTLTGMIMKEDGSDVLSEAIIDVIEKETGERRRFQSDMNGIYRCELEPGKEYIVEASKPNYYKNKPLEISTKGITRHKTILADVDLTEIEVDQPVILEQLYFDVNSWMVTDEFKLQLDELVRKLKNNPEVYIEIGAHTDSRADDVFNIKLSERRARAVADYLVSKGIASERVSWKGFGETRLLNWCSNNADCSESDHALNRRTEFRVVKIEDNTSATK